MKVVILAGGLGTRITEESQFKPKPMIEIGEKPILWHIMKGYSAYGFNDFVICLGYKAYAIKEYFVNYFHHQSDVTIDLKNNSVEVHKNVSEPWKVTLVDTGLNTMTGGRLKRVQDYIGNEPFMLTYGDGVANLNIQKLVDFHKEHGRIATLTAVEPLGRFGTLDIGQENSITTFKEKSPGSEGWINAGFFVLEPQVFDFIQDGDQTIWERAPMENIAKDGQFMAYKHDGFWKCMDAMRDKMELEEMWSQPSPPWKTWV